MNSEIVLTADGSHTLYVPELKEHYHSANGAITESRHIFINHGYNAIDRAISEVFILEVGFGTGLNALLTWYTALGQGRKIHYIALDPNMLQLSTISKLNYPRFFSEKNAAGIYFKIHDADCGKEIFIDRHFNIYKMETSLDKVDFNGLKFHLVYFDAFSPKVQPELWTSDIFRKLFKVMLPYAILITYSAKGEVKRTLKRCGFTINSLPGPIGKREITRAIIPSYLISNS